jgi:hexosaminidase
MLMLSFKHVVITASLLLSFLVRAELPPGAESLDLMPWPRQVVLPDVAQKWVLDNHLAIAVSGDDLGEMPTLWRSRIERQTGWQLLPAPQDSTRAGIQIYIAKRVAAVPQLASDESYQLIVTPQGATLAAATRFGALRGMETLLQLLRRDGDNTFLPAVTINDAPRFPWRGLLLDPARHFLPVADILRQLDGMAAAKLNVLHWHLTDDQGWRFASTHYPRLQQLASDGNFYTPQQMKEVVAYATRLGIRVVPEIDFPGHASSIAVAYPALLSAPGPYAMERGWGVHPPTLDPGNEKVYAFIDTLTGELAEIFPDAYLHIGGDEVDDSQWKQSKKIQAFMHRQQLADSHALQAYFNQRVEKILARHHRKMVGWDEIFHPDLPHNIVIQSWQGPDSLAASAAQGYQGILSTGFYLDQPQSTAYHYRNAILPQTLDVETKVAKDEKAQSWQFTMPRLKGSAVTGSFTLIDGEKGWRGFIDFSGKTRRALHDIHWQRDGQLSFAVDSWMGDTQPVLNLQQGKLSGYFLLGNVRYPVSGSALEAIPAGLPPQVPDQAAMKNILGGEAALWSENVTPEILDIKLWPRTFAVAERLWSPQDVQDEANMYQRLEAIDSWSVVSVGLQQQAESSRLLTRLANSNDIMPLQLFASALEPAQYYTRQHLKFQAGQYNQFAALNRLADALPAESKATRQLDQQLQILIAHPQDKSAAQAVGVQLALWRNNTAWVQPLLAQNSVLKPLQPVAEQVQRLSELGLMLLDKWQKGQGISDSYRQLAQRQLDDAALVQDEVVIAMVNPLTRLLNALKVQ